MTVSENGMFSYDGLTYYVLDMEAFMAFVSNDVASERNNTTIITQYYDKGGSDEPTATKETESIIDLKSKEVSETKTTKNTDFVQIRYDFIRGLLQNITTAIFDGTGQMVTQFTFGQVLILNTLMNMGIIKEITK